MKRSLLVLLILTLLPYNLVMAQGKIGFVGNVWDETSLLAIGYGNEVYKDIWAFGSFESGFYKSLEAKLGFFHSFGFASIGAIYGLDWEHRNTVPDEQDAISYLSRASGFIGTVHIMTVGEQEQPLGAWGMADYNEKAANWSFGVGLYLGL